MKTFAFAVACFSALVSLTASAESVSFEVLSFRSAAVNRIHYLTISPSANGQLNVAIDPNHCSASGPCTLRHVRIFQVTPTVISDERDRDGNLLLRLNSEIELRVDSGFNPAGKIGYTAIVTDASGQKKEYPLSADVGTRFNK